MPNLPHVLNAALWAIQGESDRDAITPALSDWKLARSVALAPDAHSVIRSLAALCGNLLALLTPPIVSDPAPHDAVAWMIGKPEGKSVLQGWAQIAPAGWRREHVAALVNAVNNAACRASAGAALIGPCNASAGLLHFHDAIAFAIRRWGQSTPDAPTAWMHALSARERDRLIDVVQRAPHDVACCLPWLPPDRMNQALVDAVPLGVAFATFAVASPTARARYADLLRRMIAHARPHHLEGLARLACAMPAEQAAEVWTRVQTLVQDSPSSVYHVIVAAPWNDLPEPIRETIVCSNDPALRAAVNVARGQTCSVKPLAYAAALFFTVINPQAWDALPPAEQRRWRDALRRSAAHLAIRSPGLRPDILAQAEMDDNLVHAVNRHARNAAALRWALFPVALRELSPDTAHALIAALPTPPPDPGAFFCIAAGCDDSDVLTSARADLRSSAEVVRFVAFQRAASRHDSIVDRCAALHDALRGWTWEQLNAPMPLVDANVRDILMVDRDALVARLAPFDREEAMRQTLEHPASLPPEIAVPVFVALKQWTSRDTPETAEAIADALRDHGDVFLALTHACGDHRLGAALLPLPEHAALANALRALARDDPPTAQRLAYALRSGDWRAATEIVLRLPTQYRDALIPAPDALVERLAHPDRQDALYQAIKILPSLPMDDDILTRFALDCLAMHHRNVRNERTAAEDIARALRAHGDVFLSIVDAIADNYLRDTLLPQPEDAALANTLRELASDDPLSAHHLGHALYDRNWRAALRVLLTAPPSPAAAVWQALDDAVRSEMVAEFGAATFGIDPIVANNPIIALALAAVQSNDADLCNAGIDALEAQPDVLRSVWDRLPQETQQFLCTRPSIAVVFADISTRALLPTAESAGIDGSFPD